MISKCSIAVIDDDLEILSLMVKMFEAIGCSNVKPFSSLESFLKYKKLGFHVIFTDLHLGGVEGISAIKEIKSRHPNASVVIITGLTSVDTVIQVMREGVSDVLLKPFTAMDLEAALKRALLSYSSVSNSLYKSKLEDNWKVRFKSLEKSYGKISSLYGSMDLDSYLNVLRSLCSNDISNVDCCLVLKDKSGIKRISGSGGFNINETNESVDFPIQETVIDEPKVKLVISCKSDLNVSRDAIRYIANLIKPVLLYKLKMASMNEAIVSMVKSLNSVLELRDTYTKHHSRRVGNYVMSYLSFEKNVIPKAELTCLFHDVGKVGISDNILMKSGPLSEKEKKVIRSHSIWGQKIVKPLETMGLDVDSLAIRHHHERWDGGGYPDGLKGEEIPFLSRLISIADSHDAMVSMRVYRSSMDMDAVRRELISNAGKQFDPELVKNYVRYWWSSL